MHLIGVNGFKRSGKGTVANIVSDLAYASPTTVAQIGFADKLKILGARTLGYTDLSDAECIALMDKFKEPGGRIDWEYVNALDVRCPQPSLTGREYLQNIGNEARQIFGENFWIDMVLPDPVAVEGWVEHDNTVLVQRRYPGLDVLLITDLRYPNEAQRVKALGGVVWEVLRPGLESDGHASEIPLPRELVDWQIHNDGDLQLLEDRVMDAWKEIA